MNENILVIHPDTDSIDFEIFQAIYQNRSCTIIMDPSLPENNIRELIEEHDVIVLIGCFDKDGLLARNSETGRYYILINETYIKLLKQKRVYSIGGKDYFAKHGVPGLHTGAILTSSFVASLYDIEATEEEIVCSAMRLMSILGDTLEMSDLREMEAKIFAEYDNIDPVSSFNKNEIIALQG